MTKNRAFIVANEETDSSAGCVAAPENAFIVAGPSVISLESGLEA
jgi:hypothetical protein